MSRINCPKCGSSALPELVWEDFDSYSSKKVKEYICYCGCHFEVIFEMKKIKILKDEKTS